MLLFKVILTANKFTIFMYKTKIFIAYFIYQIK
jgi:hypothetical protein